MLICVVSNFKTRPPKMHISGYRYLQSAGFLSPFLHLRLFFMPSITSRSFIFASLQAFPGFTFLALFCRRTQGDARARRHGGTSKTLVVTGWVPRCKVKAKMNEASQGTGAVWGSRASAQVQWVSAQVQGESNNEWSFTVWSFTVWSFTTPQKPWQKPCVFVDENFADDVMLTEHKALCFCWWCYVNIAQTPVFLLLMLC